VGKKGRREEEEEGEEEEQKKISNTISVLPIYNERR